MNKISKSICEPRKQTSHCIVSMFWPKQMYDRNTSPNPRRGKSKEQIVLSTCVGYGLKKHQKPQTQTHSCWGHTIKWASHLWQCELPSTPMSLAMETVHTSLLNCFAIAWTVQCSQVDCTGILSVIWIVSYEHWSSRKQKILCVHSTVSCYFWPPSGLLLCLTGGRTAGLAASKTQQPIVPINEQDE